ncbi:hypothetical protein JW766_05885 [Candidatus Dojkabacteria bacterium]|nr:hypothetical protein [Candidatus Dojkabacteria bacterium]
MDPKINELKNRISELEKQIKEQGEKGPEKEPADSFEPLKILLAWKAPARIFVQRDKPWFLKIAIIALFIILFFAFLQDFFVILVVCITVLVAFLLASIPPQTVEHRLTNKGIYSIDTMYKWDDLKEFCIAEKTNRKVLYVATKLTFPSRLVILIHDKDEENIVRMIGEKLTYKTTEEKQGWVSKVTDGMIIQPEKYAHLFKQKKEGRDTTDKPQTAPVKK